VFARLTRLTHGGDDLPQMLGCLFPAHPFRHALRLVEQLAVNAHRAPRRLGHVGKVLGEDAAAAVNGDRLYFLVPPIINNDLLLLALARNLLVEMFGDVRVVTDDDEHGGRSVLVVGRLLNDVVPFHPLRRQRLQRSFCFAVSHGRLRFAAGKLFARIQAVSDVLPQPVILGIRVADVVGGRDARDLDDAALDGVHQAEVADQPGERGAFDVAAALDVEGRGREVDDEGQAYRFVQLIQPLDPHRRFAQFVAVYVRAIGVFQRHGVWAPRVVRFVIEDHQPALSSALIEVAEAAAGEGFRPFRPLVHHLERFAALGVGRFGQKMVPVRHLDLAALQQGAHLLGDDVKFLVVVAGVVRPQHLQPLLDGQVGADDEEGVGEALVAGHLAPVAEGPRGEHGHDDGLAAAGGHLDAHAREGVVEIDVQRFVLQVCQILGRDLGLEAQIFLAEADFVEEDDGLGRL